MGIIGWVILGLAAGAVAKIILPGRDPGGLFGTTVIGVIGAAVGGWLSAHFLHLPVNQHFFDARTWISAIAGSLILLILYRIFFGSSRARR